MIICWRLSLITFTLCSLNTACHICSFSSVYVALSYILLSPFLHFCLSLFWIALTDFQCFVAQWLPFPKLTFSLTRMWSDLTLSLPALNTARHFRRLSRRSLSLSLDVASSTARALASARRWLTQPLPATATIASASDCKRRFLRSGYLWQFEASCSLRYLLECGQTCNQYNSNHSHCHNPCLIYLQS